MRDIDCRRLEEKERRYDQILDAAEKVFLAKGFDAAKMDDIARRARVSRALVYVYFKDKSELQFGVCLRALTLLRERFEGAAAIHTRGLDQCSAIARAYIDFGREFPVYFESMSRFELHRPALQDTNGIEHRVMIAGIAVHQVIVQALVKGQQDGSIRKMPDPMMMVSMVLWGFTHGAMQIGQTKGKVFGLLGFAEEDFAEHSISLIIAALAAPV